MKVLTPEDMHWNFNGSSQSLRRGDLPLPYQWTVQGFNCIFLQADSIKQILKNICNLIIVNYTHSEWNYSTFMAQSYGGLIDSRSCNLPFQNLGWWHESHAAVMHIGASCANGLKPSRCATRLGMSVVAGEGGKPVQDNKGQREGWAGSGSVAWSQWQKGNIKILSLFPYPEVSLRLLWLMIGNRWCSSKVTQWSYYFTMVAWFLPQIAWIMCINSWTACYGPASKRTGLLTAWWWRQWGLWWRLFIYYLNIMQFT